MIYQPLNYNQINNIEGHNRVSSVKNRNNKSFAFWERALFQRAQSVLDFTFPEEWQGTTKDFIIYVLFKLGYGVVAKDNKYGTFFQPCTLKGYNFYYQPSSVIVTNPLLVESKEYEIGKNCELIKLTPDYMGIWDIIDYYAEKLSLLDNAINMSLVTNKYPWIVGAKNKSAAAGLKKIIDLANNGNPLIVFDQRITDDATSKSEPFQFLDLKTEYMTTAQLQDFQTILNNFDTEIGIPTIPYQKKERMVTDEANSKQLESIARVTVWLECLKTSFDEVNEMFDLGLDVKLRYEEQLDGISEDNNDRVSDLSNESE